MTLALDGDQRLTASKVKSPNYNQIAVVIVVVINALRHLRLNHTQPDSPLMLNY